MIVSCASRCVHIQVQELETCIEAAMGKFDDIEAALQLKVSRDSKDIEFLRANVLMLGDDLKLLRESLAKACTAAFPFLFVF